MTEAKLYASLSPTLLARKGSARPAMRSQLQPLGFRAQSQSYDDLGWNDMGRSETGQSDMGQSEMGLSETAPGVRALDPVDERAIAGPVVVPFMASSGQGETASGSALLPVRQVPEVVRQLDTLADRLGKRSEKPRSKALREGRKAAFTLRLDGERHLRLRLACAMQNCSAQHLITEALDRALNELPGLDEVTAQAKRH